MNGNGTALLDERRIATQRGASSKPTKPRRPSCPARNWARCVVGEYLRDWGLRDPEFVVAKCREIVDRAERLLDAEVGPHGGAEYARRLSRMAIQLAANDVDAAIAMVSSGRARTNVSPRNGEGDVPTAESFAMGMAAALEDAPEIIVARDARPRLASRVRKAAICPVDRPAPMEAQPETRLCCFLRTEFWARPWNAVRSLFAGATR